VNEASQAGCRDRAMPSERNGANASEANQAGVPGISDSERERNGANASEASQAGCRGPRRFNIGAEERI
jgi:hypothetical protein